MPAQSFAICENPMSAKVSGPVSASRAKKTLWYYRSLADKFRKRWPGQLADELLEIVEVLENGSA
jgi:hypothetical protein